MRESGAGEVLLTARCIGVTQTRGAVLRQCFRVPLLPMSNNTPFEQSIATARKVSPLRQRMIDDMMVRNFAPNTMVCYLKQVSYFARHFGRSPAG